MAVTIHVKDSQGELHTFKGDNLKFYMDDSKVRIYDYVNRKTMAEFLNPAMASYAD